MNLSKIAEKFVLNKLKLIKHGNQNLLTMTIISIW